jgi:hypothetical protein
MSIGDEFSTITSSPPFQPIFAFINADERLALATTTAQDTLTDNVTANLPLADVALVVSELTAPSPVRVEEFWTAADDNTSEPFAFVVSPDRWWRFTGQLAAGTVLALRINVDGRSTSPSCYDPGLVQPFEGTAFCEDSLVVLYRPNPHFAWAVYPDVDINTLGNNTGDGYARLTANGIGLGDYCVAWRKSPTGLSPLGDALAGWRIYPNPTSDHVTVESPRAAKGIRAQIIVRDLQGRVLMQQAVTGNRTRIDLHAIAAQNVFITAHVPGEGTVSLGQLNIVR